MVGPIKIGFSKAPEGRRRAFSYNSPVQLEIIGFVPGTHDDEDFMHQCCFEHHSHGEWFHQTPWLDEVIDEILRANSIDAVRGKLIPKGHLKSKPRGPYKTVRWIREQAELSGALQ
jgi:hypothetical protein